MIYSLLGRTVWLAAKWYLYRRYGPTRLPKPILAGGALTFALVAALAARGRSD